MTTTKEKIMGAVSVMNESDAEFLWDTIAHMYSDNHKNSIYMSAQNPFYCKNPNKIKVIHNTREVISFAEYKKKL